MGTVNTKDIPSKTNSLGQFFTPESIVDLCLNVTRIPPGNFIIEPSCGTGAFLSRFQGDVIGLEVDGSVLAKYTGAAKVENMNFYDFKLVDKDVTFIGNPPYRTPAVSVTDDPVYGRRHIVKGLAKKYGITGMREEAVFFILKSVDVILESKVRGHIYYILPKTIFHNNSKSYKMFLEFLKKYVKLESVTDLPSDFANVTTDLCYVHFSVGYGGSDTIYLHNGLERNVDEFYGVSEDIITFHRIFKKTYLGSVPCESVLLSNRGESCEDFRSRLVRLFSSEVDETNLIDLLGGENVHLAALKRNNPNKVGVVLGYVKEIQGMGLDFADPEFYKPIRHRREDRHYFRHNALKKASFVYQLNPNPCRSFYFPGNSVKGCLDYHGTCDYDVNRNCSPSANRTVPLIGLEDNLTDEFKVYWQQTGLGYDLVPAYLSYVLESDWYKGMKERYQRFYFGVPQDFLAGFKNGR